MLIERISLDPSSYSNDTGSQKLAVNIADVATEAGFGPPEKRITPFTLKQVGNKVINEELGPDDVTTYYISETSRDAAESEAGYLIRDALLKRPERTVAVWFSPPYSTDEHSEGRLTVGYNVPHSSVKEMESYGLPTADFTPEQLMYMAWRLSEYTTALLFIDNPEKLRSTPIFIELTENQNPWEFLKDFIPLPEVWDAIKTGEVNKQRQKILASANEIAPNTLFRLQHATSYLEQVGIIREMENQMKQRGHEIDQSKLDCPTSVTATSTYQLSYTDLDKDGTVLKTRLEISSGKWEYHFGSCRNCGAQDTLVGPCSICKECEKVL